MLETRGLIILLAVVALALSAAQPAGATPTAKTPTTCPKVTAVVPVMDGMYQDVTCTTGTLRVSVPGNQPAPATGPARITGRQGKKQLRDSAGRLYPIFKQ